MARKKTPAGSMLKETKRARVLRVLKELKQVRQSWERAWKAIIKEILPYRSRWDATAYNDGNPLTTNIINGTPREALRAWESGLMSGVTSPAKPWFRLTIADVKLAAKKPVKMWLEKVEKVVADALEKHGFYHSISEGGYRDLGMIGTAVIMVEEDEDDGTPTFESVPTGEYYLDVNDKGVVDTFLRERVFTVKQLVNRFGLENCSRVVQDNWNRGQLTKHVEVVQAIWPNEDYDSNEVGAKGMKWASYWCEAKGEDDKMLNEGGYNEFPALTPRLGARSGEPYGHGPGWYAVADCQALQHLMKKLAKMVDKTADPPMVAVDVLKTKSASLVPGAVTYVGDDAKNAFVPAQVIHPQSIAVLQEYIEQHENRIRDVFFYKLWMSLLNDARAQRPTATEVEHTKQEIMLQLGPVLESMNLELLDPLINRVFFIELRGGRIPPPPEELQDMSLKIQFISVMHMAQHMVGIAAIRELENHAAGLIQMGAQGALHKIDVNKLLDEIGEMSGVPRAILRTDEEVAEIEAEIAKAAQAQQQGEQMAQAAATAKDASAADPQKLSELAASLGPVVAAQANSGGV